MNLFSFIKEIFKPATELVDELHTSTEEKLAAKYNQLSLFVSFLEKGMEYEQEMLDKRSKIIMAEAQSESWLTANWRPLTMVTFLIMLVSYWFGLVDPMASERITPELMEDVFDLLKIGLGGYVASRGVEKVASGVAKSFREQ